VEQGTRALRAFIAHVDLDSFMVAVERVRSPGLRASPLIIGGQPTGRGTVAAASREARRCGVRLGMPLVQAALLCPSAAFVDGSFDSYIQASQRADDVLRRETPDVEWVSIDEAFLALPGTKPASAAVEALERIQQTLHAMGLDAACGVGRSKIVARVASQFAHPRGVVHVLDGYEARFLAPLKIEMLPGLDVTLAKKLRAAGIRRLGQIAKLSDAQLAQLAGRSAAALARQAAGIDASRLRRTPLPPRRIQDEELPRPTADAEAVLQAIHAQAERLERELRGRSVVARALTLRIRYADGHVESRSGSLSCTPAGSLDATARDLFARLHRPERLVCAIGLSCSGVLDATGVPALLF
jgi:DNA polymerase-4